MFIMDLTFALVLGKAMSMGKEIIVGFFRLLLW